MAAPISDPYEVLGVRPDVSDADLRTTYRRLVQRHHPDHNGGSPESAKRFAVIQVAYTTVLEMRRADHEAPPRPTARPLGNAAFDPGLEVRLAAMERELAEARAAQARAVAAAQEAARAASGDLPGPSRPGGTPGTSGRPRRASPEELGYFTTDDSLSRIFDDAEAEVSKRVSGARRSPFAKRLTDLFGGSDER